VDRQPVLILEESRRLVPSAESLRVLGLTGREAEVLQLVAMGKDNPEISSELGIAVSTVRKHLERVYPKLGVRSRAAAAARALTGCLALLASLTGWVGDLAVPGI
jgi:DNA-binding NarL/FixJ family response regulator